MSSGYLYQAFHTGWNILLYTLSGGRYLHLEGRMRGDRYRNWSLLFPHRPQPYLQPSSEEEIVQAVKSHDSIRLVGAGHSFNPGLVTEQATMSLDRYTGILELDREKRQARVRAGTRVRDISRLLLKEGLAFEALPSHDAQSIGGILSTDVHGTGKKLGFVSQQVVGLKIVDGRGEVHECRRGDDLFRAAIGGIGGVGIIVEVTLQCVDAFHIRQEVEVRKLDYVRARFRQLLEENDHFSLYVFPFTEWVQVHYWNPTTARKSFLGPFREYLNLVKQALGMSWFGDLVAHLGWLPKLATLMTRLQKGSNLVLQSHKGFNRTLYPIHEELEFAVPVEKTWEVTDRCLEIYQQMYPLPMMLIELRFTPAGHDILLSPGAEEASVYVNLVVVQSRGYERYYARVEHYLRSIGARPHLGKWCDGYSARDLRDLHGERFDTFQALHRRHDPAGRFTNSFTRRLFHDGGKKADPADPIFRPLEMRTLTVKNRVFRSSIAGRFDNYDGTGSPARLNFEEQFARGGVGAIISSFTPVSAAGSHMPNFATISDDDRIPFWREVGRRAHSHDCKFILQLNHCGRQRDVASVLNRHQPSISSTDEPDPLNGFPTRAMTTEEISEVVSQFAAGARRAREAGLDGVEIHGANGYLVTQFLSSAINDRTDEYGGSTANRARFLTDVLRAIRAEVGDDWHMQVKINAEDQADAVIPWLAGGNTLDDAVEIAKLAVQAGADAIHVSSGASFPHPNNPPGDFPLEILKNTYDVLISEGSKTFMNYLLLRYRPGRWMYRKLWNRARIVDFEGANAPLSARIKAAVDVPVIVTGGFQRATLIREALLAGECDAVSIARPLLANPDLVRTFEEGRELPERPCTFCNKCLAHMIEHPIGCYELERFDGDRERMIQHVMSIFRPLPWA